MEQQIENRLEAAMRGLPDDKILQVLDFASYLRSKYAPDVLGRGSVDAIFQTLDHVGPLQFAPGELDTLLEEIQAMREMDEPTDEQLSS